MHHEAHHPSEATDGCLLQVKLASGRFVCLNSVEVTMQQAASVTHAFAVCNSLSVAVVIVPEQQDISYLQQHAAQHLPSWVATLLTFTSIAEDQIPCLHNGKVDRNELMRRSLAADADAIQQVDKADEQYIG